MVAMNPYQSPESVKRPPLTRRRVVGVVFIVMSVIMALAAVFPPIVTITASLPEDRIIPAFFGMGVMSALAVLAFWLGWRRLSDDQSPRDESDSDPQPGRQTELHPPSEHADGCAN